MGAISPAACRHSGAAGHGSARVGGASKRWITSLHGPLLTRLGRAWRSVKAVESSESASRKPVGGFACMSEPSSRATASTESAPSASAIRFQEPSVLIATGKGDTFPFTVGFSKSSALPPPGCFISRSASSVISSSVATGCAMRFNSPARSSASTNSENDA